MTWVQSRSSKAGIFTTCSNMNTVHVEYCTVFMSNIQTILIFMSLVAF